MTARSMVSLRPSSAILTVDWRDRSNWHSCAPAHDLSFYSVTMFTIIMLLWRANSPLELAIVQIGGVLCTLSSNSKWLLSILHSEFEIFFHTFSLKSNFFLFHTIIPCAAPKASKLSLVDVELDGSSRTPSRLTWFSWFKCNPVFNWWVKAAKSSNETFQFFTQKSFSRSDDVERLNTSEGNIGHGGKTLSQTLVS